MTTEGTYWSGDRTYATQANLRRLFWDQHPQFRHERRQRVNNRQKQHNDYSEECRTTFHQWKDALHRAGKMTDKLCQTATVGWG